MKQNTAPDISELTDIQDIKIDMDLPREERIINFLRQIKNPYFCRYGDVVIESVFAENSITLTERMEQYLRMS